jgi:hypothetical protein
MLASGFSSSSSPRLCLPSLSTTLYSPFSLLDGLFALLFFFFSFFIFFEVSAIPGIYPSSSLAYFSSFFDFDFGTHTFLIIDYCSLAALIVLIVLI